VPPPIPGGQGKAIFLTVLQRLLQPQSSPAVQSYRMQKAVKLTKHFFRHYIYDDRAALETLLRQLIDAYKSNPLLNWHGFTFDLLTDAIFGAYSSLPTTSQAQKLVNMRLGINLLYQCLLSINATFPQQRSMETSRDALSCAFFLLSTSAEKQFFLGDLRCYFQLIEEAIPHFEERARLADGCDITYRFLGLFDLQSSPYQSSLAKADYKQCATLFNKLLSAVLNSQMPLGKAYQLALKYYTIAKEQYKLYAQCPEQLAAADLLLDSKKPNGVAHH
jgi:hypothetical protein